MSVLPWPPSAEKSVIMSRTTRASPDIVVFGQLFVGHGLKRWSRAWVTVVPRLPVLSGTQSGAPAGGLGSGQRSALLIWYCVVQPYWSACVKELSPPPYTP